MNNAQIYVWFFWLVKNLLCKRLQLQLTIHANGSRWNRTTFTEIKKLELNFKLCILTLRLSYTVPWSVFHLFVDGCKHVRFGIDQITMWVNGYILLDQLWWFLYSAQCPVHYRVSKIHWPTYKIQNSREWLINYYSVHIITLSFSQHWRRETRNATPLSPCELRYFWSLSNRGRDEFVLID